jgi:uncharacterized protein YecT (DUF1311 family)
MKRLLAIPLLLIGALSHAQGTNPAANPYSSEYVACMKKAGPPGFYDQSAAANCDAAEVRFQKKRINTAYDRILKMWENDPQEITKLNNAQKAWVQWRDGTYDLLQEAGGTNGQVVYVVSSDFLLKSLVDQANLLEGILSANGGN